MRFIALQQSIENPNGKSMYLRLKRVYPKSLILAVSISAFNSGLKVMFGLATWDVFKKCYGLDDFEIDLL
jgi:hypothetical protein